MVRTIAATILTNKDAKHNRQAPVFVDMTNSSAQIANVFQNHSNATHNLTVLITLMKSVVNRLKLSHHHRQWFDFNLDLFSTSLAVLLEIQVS